MSHPAEMHGADQQQRAFEIVCRVLLLMALIAAPTWSTLADERVIRKMHFSVRLPENREWETQEETSASLVVGIGPSAGYSVVIQFKVSDISSKGSTDFRQLSKPVLRDHYYDLFSQQEMSLRNTKILSRSAKQKLESYSVELNPVSAHRHAGAVCLLTSLHMLDTRVPGAEGQQYKMPALTYWCFHPTRPGMLAELSYSQRYPKDSEGEANIEWRQYSRKYIETLNFE